jgi:hypothetical protein
MDDLIPTIPSIPFGLREAAKEGKLVPFIGAGVSKIAGCPNWAEFADGALHWMITQGQFSHGRLAQISHLNPRVKLSIALRLQEETGAQIDFLKLLHPNERAANVKGIKLYEHISKLANSFVTTNYDKWLDEDVSNPSMSVKSGEAAPSMQAVPTKRRIIYRVADLTLANLNQPNTVIHLHGTVDAPDCMIMTTKHYVQHYANDRGANTSENRVLTFLDHLFHQKTVLFIGYGLEELEILEYVISNVQPASQIETSKANHYLVQGFFRHEYELMRSLEQYYINECGIQLLAYPRDEKDWDQLLDVMELFAREIPASPLLMSQKAKEMKNLLYGTT